MDKNALMEKNLYELFELPSSTTVQEIKKSYRKKALKCHPDKNPDNPNAVKLFLELSTALEILVEESSRAVYDKLLTARQAAKIRHDALDSRRKKLKEDLDAQEKRAADLTSEENIGKTAEARLIAEIDRLRKDGSRQLLEEMEKVTEQLKEEMLFRQPPTAEDGTTYRLKVKWKSDKADQENGGYNSDNLNKIFSKYGDISCLIVSQNKNGKALLEFETKTSAVQAFKLEKGFTKNPLRLSFLNGMHDIKSLSTFPDYTKRCTPLNQCGHEEQGGTGGLFPSFSTRPISTNKSNRQQSSLNPDEDFEAMVFAKMREAQEKKDSGV